MTKSKDCKNCDTKPTKKGSASTKRASDCSNCGKSK